MRRRRLRPLADALLLAAALAPGAAGAEPDDDGLPRQVAPIDAAVLAREGKATFRHSAADLGSPGDAFDGRPGTVLRTRSVNPAFLEISFPEPRTVRSAQAFFPGGAPHEWSLSAGDSARELVTLFEGRIVPPDAWSAVETFQHPVEARVFRIDARRLAGDDHVHFGEIALVVSQRPVAIEIESFSDVVTKGGRLPVRARVKYDGGFRSSAAHGLEFLAEPADVVRLESLAPHEPAGVTLRHLRSGRAEVSARIRGREETIRSAPLALDVRDDGLPDWDVTCIERMPRRAFDAPDGGVPRHGETVVWRAHVKNYGTADARRVECAWEVDGRPVAAGNLDAIDRFAEATADLRLPWDGTRHEVRFRVNPSGESAETTTGNDTRAVATDALLLGLWVERPLLAWFHRTQSAFGDGANSFEDWAQRQVARWNGMLAGAVHPLTPAGVSDRVALDRIVVVEEGALPLSGGLPTNDPDAADRTVDLQWGFPARLLDGDFYRRGAARSDDNPLWLEGSLLHELGHARYLVDLYRLDVHAAEVRIAGDDGRPVAGTPAMPAVAGTRVHRNSAGGLMADDFPRGYDAHSAAALQRIAGRRAHGGNRNPPPELGEYLGDLPRSCGVRVLSSDGRPLDGVEVAAWRRGPLPSGGEGFGGEPVRRGMTAQGGWLDLSLGGADPFFDGRRGSLDAGQGVLVLSLRRRGRTCWRFLEVLPYNLAFWSGESAAHARDVPTDLPP